jgi:hypothetical protein
MTASESRGLTGTIARRRRNAPANMGSSCTVSARAEELAVRTGCAAIPPRTGKRQGAVRINDARECRRVAFLAHVPVMDPGELAQRRAAAGFGHPGQAEVDTVREHRGEQRGAVVGCSPATLMGETL